MITVGDMLNYQRGLVTSMNYTLQIRVGEERDKSWKHARILRMHKVYVTHEGYRYTWTTKES